jgi:peptidylprolyl isomerase
MRKANEIPDGLPTSALSRPEVDDLDDLFEFTDTLRISDDEHSGSNAVGKADLPPLPKDTEDILGDRGVLVKRIRPPSNPESARPSLTRRYIEVHYEAFVVESGKLFDSTRDQNYPLIALLDLPPSGKSTLIRAWEVALPTVRAGEIITLTAASRYAYGAEGVPPDIPPHADLRFEIEVLDVRSTHKKVEVIDRSEEDLSRLEEIRREREIAQQRRLDEQQLKEAGKQAKADKAAALKEKLAAKQGGPSGKKAGKKKK